jgi:hypothetical protein
MSLSFPSAMLRPSFVIGKLPCDWPGSLSGRPIPTNDGAKLFGSMSYTESRWQAQHVGSQTRGMQQKRLATIQITTDGYRCCSATEGPFRTPCRSAHSKTTAGSTSKNLLLSRLGKVCACILSPYSDSPHGELQCCRWGHRNPSNRHCAGGFGITCYCNSAG